MTDLLNRLLSRAVRDGDCLVWTGCRDKHGYGRVKAPGRSALVHRLVYELANGVRLTPDVKVRHTCDNPPCLNPEHLIKGTQAQNMVDMVERGRHRCQMKVLTPEEQQAIRESDPRIVARVIAEEYGITPGRVRRLRASA